MPRSLGTLEGRTFAAVLFDMDGTLIDSIPVVIRSWVRWAQEEGVDPRRLAGFHGVPARGVIAALLPPERVDAAFDRIEAIEIADTDGITILPGTLDALARALAGDGGATCCHRHLVHPPARRRAARRDRAAGAGGGRHRERRGAGQAAPRPVPARRLRGSGSTRRLPRGRGRARLVSRPARAAGARRWRSRRRRPRPTSSRTPSWRTLADVRFSVVAGRVHVTAAVTGP